MNFPELLDFSKNKTRIAIPISENLAQLLLHCIEFCGKEVDYFSESETFEKRDSDFLLFRTLDLENASEFEPNIVFIPTNFSEENLGTLLKKITSGGILVYPENMEIPSSGVYFRKIPFSIPEYSEENKIAILSTEMGKIPFSTTNSSILENIIGLQFLCQQLGIMEDEFYDAIINFG